MPTAKYFSKCPEFPADVSVSDIPTVSFEKLERGADDEPNRLYNACREFGFFKLDLQSSENGRVLLQHAEMMLDVCAETLTLDRAILNNYAYNPPKDLLGYKTAGKLKTDDGKLDATEMYTLGQGDMLSASPLRSNPPSLEDHRADCRAFFLIASSTVQTILSALDKTLGLPEDTLPALYRLNKPSDTSLRMLLSHPSTVKATGNRITLGGHTDIGIITMLFHVVGGLQILPAAAENTYENWRFIKPQQGCAIVNLGDTIVEWTSGVLRSSLHRVVNPPGQQAAVARQSLAYLVRPAREKTMQRLKGSKIPVIPEVQLDSDVSVAEWASTRAAQIMRGELRPRTIGGTAIGVYD